MDNDIISKHILEAVDMEENSFDDFYDCGSFHKQLDSIIQEVDTLAEDFHPDTVITVQRKGNRLWKDILFFDRPSCLEGIECVTDSDIDGIGLDGRMILVVDDSMKEGRHVSQVLEKITAYVPKENIRVFVVSTNIAATSYIEREYGVKVTSMHTFHDYIEQSEEYESTILCLVEGFGFQYTPGYRCLESVINGIGSEVMERYLIQTCLQIFGQCDTDRITNCRKTSKITLIPSNIPFDECDRTQNNKIFLTIGAHDDQVKVLIEILFNPLIPGDIAGKSEIYRITDLLGDKVLDKMCSVMDGLLKENSLEFGEQPCRFTQSENRLY